MKAPVKHRLAGLYAVTPDLDDTQRLLGMVEAAIAGGAAAIQYRHKTADLALKRAQVKILLTVTRKTGVPLIVNDDLALALDLGADGVHLGRDDGELAVARAKLGSERILGVSCYDESARADAARAAGADYLAFGSVYPSGVKPGAVRAPLSLFAQARAASDLPLVAIGGITAENAPAVIDAGANAVAVISAVFGAADVRAAAEKIARLFTPVHS